MEHGCRIFSAQIYQKLNWSSPDNGKGGSINFIIEVKDQHKEIDGIQAGRSG